MLVPAMHTLRAIPTSQALSKVLEPRINLVEFANLSIRDSGVIDLTVIYLLVRAFQEQQASPP